MTRSISFVMLMLAASLAQAATINLTGTIRDFKGKNEAGGHPDFEGVIGGVQTGQVASVLGPTGLPVFLNPPKPGFTNATSFDQWWRDNSFNQKSTSTITLDDAGHPGIFTFADDSFFPIDGMLFGNTPGFPRNYHFTYQISTTFSFTGGETFTFTGDDDLYVFLNGQLAVDIGGVHRPASRTITLSPGDFGMAAGQNYAFDLFFAERHTVLSNFRIDTTLALRDNPNPPDDTAVPEPSSYALLGAGLVLVLGLRRRI